MTRRRRRGEGSVFRRANGQWLAQVGYRGPDGRRKYLTRIRTTERAARLDLASLLARVGRDGGLVDAREPLGRFLRGWLERISVSEATMRSYRGHIEHHIDPLLGGVRLEELRVVDVDRLVRATARAGLSASTTRRILTTLSMALEVAVNDGTLPRNVVRSVKRPKVVRPPISAMTRDQARAILAAVAADSNAAIYELLLGSGLRAGEAVALNWRDVDLDVGTVFVRKGKTARSVRTIPIPEKTIAALRTHRAKTGVIDPTAPVFTGTRKHQRLRTDVVLHRLVALLEAAGLPRMRVHDLRHAHATLLLAAGAPMQLIADQLGHASPAVTANVYVHVQPGALRKVVNDLNDYLDD